LFGEAAAYFGAVARKFPRPRLARGLCSPRANAYANGAKDNPTALQSVRTAIRQYPETQFPEQAKQLQRRYDELAMAVDAENSGTVYYKVMDGLVRLVGGSKVLALVVFLSALPCLVAAPDAPVSCVQGDDALRAAAQKDQEKYKDDKGLQQEKVMEFYKEHGLIPFASCLPLLMQMPFIYLLYTCIAHYQYQFHQTNFLWINPDIAALSSTWPAPLSHIVGRNLGEQDVPLLFIYALSFYLQTKLNPVTDPAQAEQQRSWLSPCRPCRS
jgi:YidC/Oxa1 family membrane protein insertase